MDALSQPHGFMSHHLVLKKARQLCLLVRIGLIAEIEDYHKTFSIIPLEVSSWRKVIKPDATTCTNAPSISKTVQENVPIKGKTKAASEILKVVITFLHLLHNTNPRWISFSPVEGNRCLEHISFTFNQSLALNFIGWKAYSFFTERSWCFSWKISNFEEEKTCLISFDPISLVTAVQRRWNFVPMFSKQYFD